MGEESRLAVRAAVITVVLGLAACAGPDGAPAPAASPAIGQTTAGAAEPSAEGAEPSAEGAEASATVPVKGGKIAADLGVQTKGGTFTPLIVRGTAVPAKHSEIFTTAEDNQPRIKIEVFHGVSDRAADGRRVGTYEVIVPAPGPKGVPQFSVTFAIDASGAFRLTATDSTSGAPVTVAALS
jgi:molecular chaperone DnaK (HSP70)